MENAVEVGLELDVVGRTGAAFVVDGDEEGFGRVFVEPGVDSEKNVFESGCWSEECYGCSKPELRCQSSKEGKREDENTVQWWKPMVSFPRLYAMRRSKTRIPSLRLWKMERCWVWKTLAGGMFLGGGIGYHDELV